MLLGWTPHYGQNLQILSKNYGVFLGCAHLHAASKDHNFCSFSRRYTSDFEQKHLSIENNVGNLSAVTLQAAFRQLSVSHQAAAHSMKVTLYSYFLSYERFGSWKIQCYTKFM